MALAKLGAVAEFMQNEFFTLQVGANFYGAVENLILQVGRREERRGTLDSGPKYAFGQGDNFFSATIIATKPELDGTAWTNQTTPASFNELSQLDSNGELNLIQWKIVGESVGDTLTTFAATGFLKQYAIRKGEKGKVLIDILVRIDGDTVSIS